MTFLKCLSLFLLFFLSNQLQSSEELDFLIEKGGKRAKKYMQLCKRMENDYSSEAPCECDEIPFVYDTMWPFFCLNHLIHDPLRCSSWKFDQDGNLQPEFQKKGNALCWVDNNLIQRIGEKWKLIPKFDEDSDGVTNCDYGHCSICDNSIIRDYWHFPPYEDEDSYSLGDGYILYRCQCFKPYEWYWVYVGVDEHHTCNGDYCYKFIKKCPHWHFCMKPSIFPGYFNWSYQTYFSFFEQFLAYLDTNRACCCYWPHSDSRAEWISDTAFLVLDRLAECTSLVKEMENKKFSVFLNNEIREEFARGLILHAYFYSHYHRIFNDIEQFSSKNLSASDHQKVHKNLLIARNEIIPYFQKLYSQCLYEHPHPKIYYERGMVNFHSGSLLESIDDIRHWIAYAEANNYQSLLTSDHYLQEGTLLNGLL